MDNDMPNTSFDYQSIDIQPPLSNFEDYPFDDSCRHRNLQDLSKFMGVSNDAMGNSSPVHPAVQSKNNPTSARKVGGTSIEDPRTELEELREVLRSFSKTLTKIGLAMNHIMGEMPPARSESIIRSIKEDLRRMSPNPA